jgi:hypothetical protein
MKKILLFAAMVLTLVGCTEDYKDWTVQNPDTTPDEAIKVSQNMADVPAIDYANVDPEGNVQLFVPTYESSSNPDSVIYKAIIYNADMSESVEMTANAKGEVPAALLKETLQTFYGKLPEQKLVPAQFIARVYTGKMVSKEMHETILDITIPYHGKPALKALAVPGSYQGWNPAGYDQALYEKDPENNPNVFSGYICMDANTEFKFADGSWDVNWGTEDGHTLVPGGPNIKVDAEGCYYITVDLNALTYSIEQRNWSLVGDGIGGWDKDVDLTYSKENSAYYVTFDFTGSGEFKFRANHDWTYNLGIDKDGEPGDLIQDGKNIASPGAGTYSIILSFFGGYPTYEIIEGSDISKFPPYLYFIGATDGWNNDEPNRQRLALENGIYTGYLYCADPNGWGNEFKFQKVPGDWGSEINTGMMTGGITGDFEDAGGNFKANAGEGVYFVTFNISKMTIEGTKVEKMGIIGDFNGWGGDVEMTWNAAEYCFEATNAGINANGWKFRMNADWAVNLGSNDTTEPSTVIDDLVGNGKNIGVVGNTIKLYPTRKTSDKIFCTVE